MPIASAENPYGESSIANLTTNSTMSPAALFITIDPIGDHTIGDIFFVNGTTNLPSTQKLTIFFQRYDNFGGPHGKNTPSRLLAGPEISIVSTPQVNRWSVNITELAANLTNTEYVVWISSPDVGASDVFTLYPANHVTITNVPPSILQTTTQSHLPSQFAMNSATTIPSTQSSSLSFALPIALLAAIVILRHL